MLLDKLPESLQGKVNPLPSVPPASPEEQIEELTRRSSHDVQEVKRAGVADEDRSILEDLRVRLEEAGASPSAHFLLRYVSSGKVRLGSEGELPSTNLEQVLGAVFQKSRLASHPDWTGECRIELPVKRVGPYPVHSDSVTCLLSKHKGGPVECSFHQFDRLPVGTGDTAFGARRDLARKIHFALQRLLALEDFERDEADQALFDQLTRLIDVEAYEVERRVARRVVGQIAKLPADAGLPEASSGDSDWRVRWYADGHEESVGMSQVPLEFARLRPGQWFEALIERDPSTGALRRILHSQVRREPTRLNDEELRRYIEKNRYPGQPPQS